VLGGSSSINGLVYVRGNPLDFERWREEGADGWSYADVLPYFRRSETGAEGGDAYRGDGGPLHTRYGKLANPLYRAFVEAAKQAGYPETADINGFRQEGFGRLDMTVHRGRRWSAADAYLRPAMKRPNLKVVTHSADPRACDGDRFRGAKGRRRTLPARWRGARGAGEARGHPFRRRDKLAATSQTFRHRTGEGT